MNPGCRQAERRSCSGLLVGRYCISPQIGLHTEYYVINASVRGHWENSEFRFCNAASVLRLVALRPLLLVAAPSSVVAAAVPDRIVPVVQDVVKEPPLVSTPALVHPQP
jgi:hypothetical protein